MPTNGLLLLLKLDWPIIKGTHSCRFCILMQLLTHYDHVIVQSLIVYPVCDAKSVIAEKMWHYFFFLSFAPRYSRKVFLAKKGFAPVD